MDFIWFILIGALAGLLAGRIVKGKGFRFIANLVVGIVGGVVGGFVLGLIGFQAVGLIARVISATFGAVVFLAIVGWLGKKR